MRSLFTEINAISSPEKKADNSNIKMTSVMEDMN